MVRKVFEDTKQALDVAFSAGVLVSKTQNHAQEESIRFSLPDSQMRDELNRATLLLKKTSTNIDELLNKKYKDKEVPADTNSFFYHWFEDDLNFADKAEGLVRQLEDTIKRSYDLAITKVSDPTSLGARPKDTYIASHQKMYPTLEEEAAPAPERTRDWVHVSEFEDSRKKDLQQDYIEQKVSKSVTFDEASGQPPRLCPDNKDAADYSSANQSISARIPTI